MSVSVTVKKIISDSGRTQSWVVARMNQIDPGINMNRSKLSAIVCGIRKMTGEELLAFCKATGANPDLFLYESRKESV